MIQYKNSFVNQILPFKIETTRHIITAQGLILFGEFIYGLKMASIIDKYPPALGSSRGYTTSEFVIPVILMLNRRDRAIKDSREIKMDEGLRELLQLEKTPSTDATENWLRKMGMSEGLKRFDELKGVIYISSLK